MRNTIRKHDMLLKIGAIGMMLPVNHNTKK